MKKTILMFSLVIISVAALGQTHNSRLSVFSGAGYNQDYNKFSFNMGTEYSYYLSNRIYVLGTFYSNFKSLEAAVTVNNDTSQLNATNVPVNNLRLQLGTGVDFLRPNKYNRLYLQGQAGLGYVFGSTRLPVIGRVSYKGSMIAVGGSFGYDRKFNNQWTLGGAYTIDYNLVHINHGLIIKASYSF